MYMYSTELTEEWARQSGPWAMGKHKFSPHALSRINFYSYLHPSRWSPEPRAILVKCTLQMHGKKGRGNVRNVYFHTSHSHARVSKVKVIFAQKPLGCADRCPIPFVSAGLIDIFLLPGRPIDIRVIAEAAEFHYKKGEERGEKYR